MSEIEQQPETQPQLADIEPAAPLAGAAGPEELGREPASTLPLTRLRGPAAAAVTLRWAPITASAIAVVLSLASIFVSTQDPDVVLILPDTVRLAGGPQTGASYMYLQPTFVSTGNNDRIEVIRDMHVLVRKHGVDETTMEWTEQARFSLGDDGRLSYGYGADAVPLLIGPRAAQNPLGTFTAPQGWHLGDGTYEFTLVAERVVGGAPLEESFEVTLTPDDLAVLYAPGGEQFLPFTLESVRR